MIGEAAGQDGFIEVCNGADPTRCLGGSEATTDIYVLYIGSNQFPSSVAHLPRVTQANGISLCDLLDWFASKETSKPGRSCGSACTGSLVGMSVTKKPQSGFFSLEGETLVLVDNSGMLYSQIKSVSGSNMKLKRSMRGARPFPTSSAARNALSQRIGPLNGMFSAGCKRTDAPRCERAVESCMQIKRMSGIIEPEDMAILKRALDDEDRDCLGEALTALQILTVSIVRQDSTECLFDAEDARSSVALVIYSGFANGDVARTVKGQAYLDAQRGLCGIAAVLAIGLDGNAHIALASSSSSLCAVLRHVPRLRDRAQLRRR